MGGGGGGSSDEDDGLYPPPSAWLLSGRRPRVMVALAGLLFLFLEARHYALVPSIVAHLTSGQVAALGGVASGHAFRLAVPAELATWVQGGGGADAAVPAVAAAATSPDGTGGADGTGGTDGGTALAPGPLEADEKVNSAAERLRDAHLFRSAAEVSSRTAALEAARAQAVAAARARAPETVVAAGEVPVRAGGTDNPPPAAAAAAAAATVAAAAAAAATVGSAVGTPLPTPAVGESGPEVVGPSSGLAPAVTALPGASAGAVAVASLPSSQLTATSVTPGVDPVHAVGLTDARAAAPLPPPSTAAHARESAGGDLATLPAVAAWPTDGGTANGTPRMTPSPQMAEARAAIEDMGGWVAPGAELSPPRKALDAETAGTGDLVAANAVTAAQAKTGGIGDTKEANAVASAQPETDNWDLEADVEPITRRPHPGARGEKSREGGGNGGGGDATPIRVTTLISEHEGTTAATADAGDEDDGADVRAVAHGGNHFRGVPADMIDVAAHGGIYETGTHNLTRVSHMLYRIIRHHNISSMLDVPCTAHVAWMPALLARLDYEIPSFRYQCMDSAPDVSAASRALRGASESAIVTGGVRYWEVPLPAVDLIFSWSGLEHLTLSRTFSFFYNVRASGSALALVGHHAGLENAIIRRSASGKRKTMTRPRPPGINLREQPFAFAAAERVIGGFGLPSPPGGGRQRPPPPRGAKADAAVPGQQDETIVVRGALEREVGRG
ncbi:hypothetical protein MMPV_008419 [Pyropia vietnamensis]